DDEIERAALGLQPPTLREDVGDRQVARLIYVDLGLLEPARRVADRLELREREPAAADPVAVDLRVHRDESLDHLELAHFQREDRAGLPRAERGVLDEAQREARLPKARAARDEDEVGRLQAAGLRVERLQSGQDAGLGLVAALLDLRDVPIERDLERDDVPVQRRLADREQEALRVLDRAARILANERQSRDLIRCADELPELRGPRDYRRVRLGVRHGRHVLHEPDEELGAADGAELVRRGELLLDRLE